MTPAQLYQQAAVSYAGIQSYTARFVRRDVAKNKPEETIAFSFRKEPWSVRFRWLGSVGEGREVFYVKGHYDDKIHVILAADDMPLLSGGHRISLRPKSALARRACRTPITEAGIGALLDRFHRTIDAEQGGDSGRQQTKVVGTQTRPDYDTPLVIVEQSLAPGAEHLLPQGGKRLIGFHTQNKLPVLTVLYNERDQEVYYDRFDHLQLGASLSDADFDPYREDQRSASARP